MPRKSNLSSYLGPLSCVRDWSTQRTHSAHTRSARAICRLVDFKTVFIITQKSLEKNHFSCGRKFFRRHPIKIDAAAHSRAVVVRAIPFQSVTSDPLVAAEKSFYFLTEQVEDIHLDMRAMP